MKAIAGEQPPLDDIAMPYSEYSDSDLVHRLLYVEVSRGCPFKCEFCLTALDKTATRPRKRDTGGRGFSQDGG